MNSRKIISLALAAIILLSACGREETFANKVYEQPESVAETMVWIPRTGVRYHANANCSGMDGPRLVSVTEARDLGYTPCNNCY